MLEAMLGDGVPGPDTLDAQRKARLLASGVALAIVVLVRGLAWESPTATIILVLTAVGSGWIILFSVVDVIKEPGSSRWWSTCASVVGTVALITTANLLFR
jgi:hypothetical protein